MHSKNSETALALVSKLYAAYPKGTAFLVCENYSEHASPYMSHTKEKRTLESCVDSEGPDQTAQMRSLIRAVSVRKQNHWLL